MKLVDYLALARERFLVVLLVVVLSVGTVVGFTLLQDPEYVGAVRLRARPAVPGSEATEVVERREEQTDLGTEAELVRSTAVAEAVAEEVGYDGDLDVLLDRVAVSIVPNTTVLRVSVSAPEPAEAVTLANAFAAHYLDNRREVVTAALDDEAARQSARVQDLAERLVEIDQSTAGIDPESSSGSAVFAERTRVLSDLLAARSALDAVSDRAAVAAGFGEVIQPATEASAVRSTSIPRAAVFGLLLGIPLSLAVVLLLDALNTTIRGRQDVLRATGLDVIGTVPIDPQWGNAASAYLAAVRAPFSPAAEAYRALGYALTRSLDEAGCTTLLVTSAGDGDGKTATVANLAVTSADGGRRGCVIDADLRNSRLHEFFGLGREPGLSDVLTAEVALAEAVVTVGTGLAFVPAGRRTERPDLLLARADLGGLLDRVAEDPNAAEDDASTGRRRSRLRAATSDADPAIVFIDAAPVLAAGEVSRLAAAVDAVVVVARANSTAKASLGAAVDQLRRAGGNVVGVVLIGGRIEGELAPIVVGDRATDDARERALAGSLE